MIRIRSGGTNDGRELVLEFDPESGEISISTTQKVTQPSISGDVVKAGEDIHWSCSPAAIERELEGAGFSREEAREEAVKTRGQISRQSIAIIDVIGNGDMPLDLTAYEYRHANCRLKRVQRTRDLLNEKHVLRCDCGQEIRFGVVGQATQAISNAIVDEKERVLPNGSFDSEPTVSIVRIRPVRDERSSFI